MWAFAFISRFIFCRDIKFHCPVAMTLKICSFYFSRPDIILQIHIRRSKRLIGANPIPQQHTLYIGRIGYFRSDGDRGGKTI